MSGVTGKIACITGGLSGIGYEIAKSLIKHGIKGLVIGDIQKDKAPGIIKCLQELGEGEVEYVMCDAYSRSQLECLMKSSIKRFGNLDIVINNAGVILEEDYERSIQINYINVLYSTMVALFKYLPKSKSGKDAVVLNTSSVFGIQPIQAMPVYSATSAAVVGVGRTFGTAFYYNRTKVKVLTLCPGLTSTPLIKPENLSGIDLNIFEKECNKYPLQHPKHCAMCVETMLNEGRNGSIWISEDSKCYEYPIPDRFDVRKGIAEYCCPTWMNRVHVQKIDAELNTTMRLITGTLKSTPTSWLPVLSNITPPRIRRQAILKKQFDKFKLLENQIRF